ncbi:MAG: lysylphosphatidylglycerol synthase transmembrane domain-containing protein [Nitrospirota bacterium]
MALKANKTALFILKIVVSSLLLYLVLSRTGVGNVLALLKSVNLFYFFVAVLFYILAQFLSTLRWRLLLPFTFKMRELFSLYMIGTFFNTLLPGIIGGDAVKGFYLYQATGRGGLSLASIFMDRYLGFSTLIGICVFAYPFGHQYFRGSNIEWILLLVVLVFLAGSFAVFGLQIGKKISILSDFYEYSQTYLRQRKTIIKALLLSLLVQLSVISGVFIISIGMGYHIPFISYLLFLPLIILFSSLPISVSGLGVREGAFVLFFGLIGIKADVATAISLCWFVTVVTAGLIGFVEYLKYKKRKVISSHNQQKED